MMEHCSIRAKESMPMPRALRRSPFVLGLVAGLALSAVACGPVTINQLLSDPAKYRNREVTVRGQVTESASVLGKGAYKLSDDNADLWVVTAAGAPRKGARVDVTGRVQDGYDLSAFGNVIKLPGAMRSGLVLIESSHKAKD
jgi:hypothetical protein